MKVPRLNDCKQFLFVFTKISLRLNYLANRPCFNLVQGPCEKGEKIFSFNPTLLLFLVLGEDDGGMMAS